MPINPFPSIAMVRIGLYTKVSNKIINYMNKKIIISFVLLVLLAAAAALVNFNQPVEAAYLGGGPWASNGTHIYYGDTGNVGVGSTKSSPNHRLEVDGNVGATSFIYTSDETLKNNVQVLKNSLDKISSLEGVSFDWKKDGSKEIGLIAQDVEKVVPELVVTGSDGIKSVKYGNIVALLIEAVKEQQAEIDVLKVELENLKK